MGTRSCMMSDGGPARTLDDPLACCLLREKRYVPSARERPPKSSFGLSSPSTPSYGNTELLDLIHFLHRQRPEKLPADSRWRTLSPHHATTCHSSTRGMTVSDDTSHASPQSRFVTSKIKIYIIMSQLALPAKKTTGAIRVRQQTKLNVTRG